MPIVVAFRCAALEIDRSSGIDITDVRRENIGLGRGDRSGTQKSVYWGIYVVLRA